MYATMNASTNPTASPNKIPRGTEFTLRAKIPAAIPAIKPLMVDPVAVQHAARMRERDGITNAKKDSETIGYGFHVCEVFVQPLALDKFHGVENAAIGERPDVVHGNDAGMLEPR